MKRYELCFDKTREIQNTIGHLEGKIGSQLIYVIDAKTGKIITSTTGNENSLPYDIVGPISISVSSIWDVIGRIVAILERELIGMGTIEIPLSENKLLVIKKAGPLLLVVLTTAIPMNTTLVTSHITEAAEKIATVVSEI